MKTLKDLGWGTDGEKTSVSHKDLRSDAIRDIKALENIESSGVSDTQKGFLISIYSPKVLKYIIWKFNITDEELK